MNNKLRYGGFKYSYTEFSRYICPCGCGNSISILDVPMIISDYNSLSTISSSSGIYD